MACCDLRPLDSCAVQPYVSGSMQLSDLLAWLLGQTGPSDVTVTTFSTSEAFIRRIALLRSAGLVRSATLICDLRASRKTECLMQFAAGAFDHVLLARNHSKVIIVRGGCISAAVVTSQNQTRGDRFEAGVVTTDSFTIESLSAAIDDIISCSVSADVHVR